MQKDGLVAQPGVLMFKPLQTLQFWSDQVKIRYTYASNSNLKVVKILCCSVVNYGFYATFLPANTVYVNVPIYRLVALWEKNRIKPVVHHRTA